MHYVTLWLALFGLVCSACSSGPGRPVDGEVVIPMRDGTTLATDLYFPGDAAPPYPVVLIRTPYNKAWLEGYGRYYTRWGYVVAIQDVRGRWASGGEWVPFVHEGEDGYDTIEWLAAQEWSTGRIGMVGGSYSGSVQLAAAVLEPPHLVTIVPNVTPAMPFDNLPRDGGALALGWALRWSDIVENASTGREMQEMLETAVNADWTGPLSGLPVAELDRRVAGHEVPYFREWARHPPEDEYWQAMTYHDRLEDVDIPVYLQSGWFDGGTRGTRLAYERLRAGGNRRTAMILGPWVHADRGSRYVGEQDMGAAAERDLMAGYRRWFDRWLKQGDGGEATPAVELYLMGSNRWLTGDRYPLPGTSMRRLYFTGRSSPGGPGGLQWAEPAGSGVSSFVYDPAHPTPSFHAAMKRGRLAEYLDRTRNAEDVVSFETEPLDAPLHIVGPMEATLYGSSSAVDTDWTATLYALSPAGDIRVLGLTFGILRARYRNGMEQPALLEPDSVYAFTIDMGHTAVTLRPGERLRLDIASAAFPEFSRNLNTGGNNEVEAEYMVARQQIHSGPDHPSHLVLPVVSLNGDGR
jgi:putative CocE/NonD family hydrolase